MTDSLKEMTKHSHGEYGGKGDSNMPFLWFLSTALKIKSVIIKQLTE